MNKMNKIERIEKIEKIEKNGKKEKGKKRKKNVRFQARGKKKRKLQKSTSPIVPVLQRSLVQVQKMLVSLLVQRNTFWTLNNTQRLVNNGRKELHDMLRVTTNFDQKNISRVGRDRVVETRS